MVDLAHIAHRASEFVEGIQVEETRDRLDGLGKEVIYLYRGYGNATQLSPKELQHNDDQRLIEYLVAQFKAFKTEIDLAISQSV